MQLAELERTVAGWKPAVIVLAANRLGLLAELARRPQTASALATHLELDQRAVEVVTDALVALSVLHRDGDDLMLEEELRPAADPRSPATRTHIWEHQWFGLLRWARLDELASTGQHFPRGHDDDERTRAFVTGMADLGRRSAAGIWEQVDLAACSHLVDVGGGPGEHARAALQRFPRLRVTVVDLPEVTAVARQLATVRAPDDRLLFQEGNVIHDPLPACDAALISSLLRGYGPEQVSHIAANVAAGVQPGGLVLIRETLWDDETHSGPLSTALIAINMLVATPAGRCWTAGELEDLFGQAGIGQWQRRQLEGGTTLLVGRRLSP